MNLTIYIDILFLINLILNYITICSTALISGQKIVTKKILFASIIGAIYSVIIFFPYLQILNLVLFKLIISFILIFISFKFKGYFLYFKILLIFYLVNFIYGGGMYAFYNFTSLGTRMNYSNGVFYINLPLWSIILLSFVFYYIVKLFVKISDGRIVQKNITKTEIYFNNTNIKTDALFDTGNTLYDPISLLPVMLVESNEFKGKISTEVLKEITSASSSSLLIIHNIYPELKFRIIPFQDITGKKNNLFAFKPQKIFCPDINKEYSNILIGIINTKLSTDNTYHALLHSKI